VRSPKAGRTTEQTISDEQGLILRKRIAQQRGQLNALTACYCVVNLRGKGEGLAFKNYFAAEGVRKAFYAEPNERSAGSIKLI
jgi:hypothetical protein